MEAQVSGTGRRRKRKGLLKETPFIYHTLCRLASCRDEQIPGLGDERTEAVMSQYMVWSRRWVCPPLRDPPVPLGGAACTGPPNPTHCYVKELVLSLSVQGLGAPRGGGCLGFRRHSSTASVGHDHLQFPSLNYFCHFSQV